jgi:hypothetical protein
MATNPTARFARLPCEVCGRRRRPHRPKDGHRFQVDRLAAKHARLAELEASTNPDHPDA